MELQSRNRLDPGAALSFACTVVLAVVGVVTGVHGILWFALLPFFCGICYLVTSVHDFKAVLDEHSLIVSEPSFAEIPLKHVQSLTIGGRQMAADGKKLEGPICVNHLLGTARIPQHLNVSSWSVYQRILAHVPESGADPSHNVLSAIAQEARDEFGADRVWCYAARGKLGRRVASGRAAGMGVALMAAGAVWAVAPASVPQLGDGWIFSGLLLCFVGFIWWLVSKRLQSPFPPGAKGWRNAGLVITPKEIGVVQGDLKGRLRWDEIIELRLGGKVEKLQLTSGAERYSIVLSVEGAVFTLGDIYDRPLAIIYERLRRYWRPS